MEVRPIELRAAARVLALDVTGVRQRLHRLRVAADAVSLQPADPALDHSLAFRQAQAIAGLLQSATAMAGVAAELDSAAADAMLADRTADSRGRLGPTEGDAPICRLPDSWRSALDRGLTDLVGAGLSSAAAEAVGLAGSILPSGDHPVSGDPGGRFSSRPVSFPTSETAGNSTGPRSPARRFLIAALDATADQSVLAHDEFGLVHHGGDRYTVVLPGVTDLSRPEPGWSPIHRSPRDFDMAAVPSSRSGKVDDNVYARSVVDALAAIGLPAGSELLIVGHSYGADTALDLASDPAFAGRYEVSHVVATGYFSQPQLPSAPADTKVLVVQNRHDIVVRLGSVMPTNETGVLACQPTRPGDQLNVSMVRFDGGLGGLGHSVDVYRPVFAGRADLESGDAAAVSDFVESIDRTMERPATMLAIDISLPERRPPELRRR